MVHYGEMPVFPYKKIDLNFHLWYDKFVGAVGRLSLFAIFANF